MAYDSVLAAELKVIRRLDEKKAPPYWANKIWRVR